jgi:hypothetical protein
MRCEPRVTTSGNVPGDPHNQRSSREPGVHPSDRLPFDPNTIPSQQMDVDAGPEERGR